MGILLNVICVAYFLVGLGFTLSILGSMWNDGDPLGFVLFLCISPIVTLLWGPVALFWLIIQIICLPFKMLMGYRWNTDVLDL